MDTMTTTWNGSDPAAPYALEVRLLSPVDQLRPTGGVRLRAFGDIAPTTSPPGPQLS